MRPPFGVNLQALFSEVADDLSQPGRVGFQVHRIRRQRHGQFVIQALTDRPSGFDGVMHDRRQFDRLPAKFDLAQADAAHVQQVVDETHHLPDLTLHHLGHAFDLLLVAL